MSKAANSRAEQIAGHVASPNKDQDPALHSGDKVRAQLKAIKGKPRLADKVCIITGAGSVPHGIGRATASELGANEQHHLKTNVDHLLV